MSQSQPEKPDWIVVAVAEDGQMGHVIGPLNQTEAHQFVEANRRLADLIGLRLASYHMWPPDLWIEDSEAILRDIERYF
jgi:hypothetical protein